MYKYITASATNSGVNTTASQTRVYFTLSHVYYQIKANKRRSLVVKFYSEPVVHKSQLVERCRCTFLLVYTIVVYPETVAFDYLVTEYTVIYYLDCIKIKVE